MIYVQQVPIMQSSSVTIIESEIKLSAFVNPSEELKQINRNCLRTRVHNKNDKDQKYSHFLLY